jgi:hypothetical protein
VTRDEIKLVAFILSALVIGALVQHLRTRSPLPPAAAPEPARHGWAKPPYVNKGGKDKPDDRRDEAQ